MQDVLHIYARIRRIVDKLHTQKATRPSKFKPWCYERSIAQSASLWCPSDVFVNLIMCRVGVDVEVIHMIVLWLTKLTCMTVVI